LCRQLRISNCWPYKGWKGWVTVKSPSARDGDGVVDGLVQCLCRTVSRRVVTVRLNILLRQVSLKPPPNEVGHRRGALRSFSIAPFPNDTGKFPCMSLSRATGPSQWDSERTYALRGLSTPCHEGLSLLPPFAL